MTYSGFPPPRIWIWVTDPPSTIYMEVLVYGSTVLLGMGSSILQVTSFSMIADLIGSTKVYIDTCMQATYYAYICSYNKVVVISSSDHNIHRYYVLGTLT